MLPYRNTKKNNKYQNLKRGIFDLVGASVLLFATSCGNTNTEDHNSSDKEEKPVQVVTNSIDLEALGSTEIASLSLLSDITKRNFTFPPKYPKWTQKLIGEIISKDAATAIEPKITDLKYIIGKGIDRLNSGLYFYPSIGKSPYATYTHPLFFTDKDKSEDEYFGVFYDNGHVYNYKTVTDYDIYSEHVKLKESLTAELDKNSKLLPGLQSNLSSADEGDKPSLNSLISSTTSQIEKLKTSIAEFDRNIELLSHKYSIAKTDDGSDVKPKMAASPPRSGFFNSQLWEYGVPKPVKAPAPPVKPATPGSGSGDKIKKTSHPKGAKA